MTRKWYATLRHPKMYPHTKFGIPTSKNIGDMDRTRKRDGRTDGRTDGLTDSAITICLPKFLWGHKNDPSLHRPMYVSIRVPHPPTPHYPMTPNIIFSSTFAKSVMPSKRKAASKSKQSLDPRARLSPVQVQCPVQLYQMTSSSMIPLFLYQNLVSVITRFATNTHE